jgi:uncharacterized protein
MNTCFYEGVILHRRHVPFRHAFRYRLFMVYVDLAELETAFGRRGLWSERGPAVARFRRADYLGDPALPLDTAVRDLVETRLGHRPEGAIRLLTNFRYLGFAMNPVSFYFVFNHDEQLETLVAEVRNTPWNERHCYVLDVRRQPSIRRASNAKEFHVSPFLEMAMTYRWTIRPPDDRLTVRIENHSETGRPFDAVLHLARRPFTAWHRWRLLLTYPLLTVRIFVGIYWQALRLWWKGATFVPHPATRPAGKDPTSVGTAERPIPHLS